MRRLAVALPAAMGQVCGVYAIVYLVRWEWNRAIIAGLFFVAVEVVVATSLLLERLRRIEERLDATAGRAEIVTRRTTPDVRSAIKMV